MDLTRYADDLTRRLAAAVDPAETAAVERLLAPFDAAVRLVLQDVLVAAADEISAELAPGAVEVRLRGGAPELVVTPPPAAAAPAAAVEVDVDGASTSRTTLRLPDHLKSQVETAATRDGVSVNTWLVRAVATALGQQAAAPARGATPGSGARRVTGWVR
ncbi:histidine kinase [Sanguibacter sp. HDW7]|uniref:histidine kinase n=1 Tax=Sanguibacter sp. HDW7 TaxID=2714931 RepID=UPI00140BCB45|nr:histidine kinase [Sanguibacter sp. HDW7]QIK83850.1 histidine kinase [Sanguibacter sp. HDW7]